MPPEGIAYNLITIYLLLEEPWYYDQATDGIMLLIRSRQNT